MKHESFGCACCTPEFGYIFRRNRVVANLGASVSCSHAIENDLLHTDDSTSRRDFLKVSLGVAVIGSLWPSVGYAEAAPTTILFGGTILAVDVEFSEADAMAFRGGRILAVGTEQVVRAIAGGDARFVDLNGKVVLPGFIDPHTHVVAGAVIDSVMEYVGMARFTKTTEVLDHLRAMAANRAPGEWIAARNFDPAVQTGPDALTFAQLDAVSTEHPVFVLNASGHIAYANSKAFEVAGIGEDVANPPGAEFVRDASGKLTGTMKNNVAFLQVLDKYPALAAQDPVEALIGLSKKFNAKGLTTASELSLGALSQSVADIEVLTGAAASGQLTMRVRAYLFYTLDKEWDESGMQPRQDGELVRIAGYKLVADGSNQGFTGLQREPYLNTDSHGLAYMQPEELKRLAMKRANQGWQLAIHGNGDRAIDNVLDAFEAVRDAGVNMSKVRGRIEHCSILHDDQIARMKELGISASFLIGHVYFWGVAMRDDVFGERKANLLDRCKSCEEAGVGFTLHSDFLVTDPDPLHMIEMAVTRRTWKEPDYVLAPAERVSVESAIRAVTAEAAWQLCSEHEIGSLESGKLADFVILDQDPRKVEPTAIKDIQVMETWLDGKQVYRG
jgi:predicted amidohydrolase YtcJ